MCTLCPGDKHCCDFHFQSQKHMRRVAAWWHQWHARCFHARCFSLYPCPVDLGVEAIGKRFPGCTDMDLRWRPGMGWTPMQGTMEFRLLEHAPQWFWLMLSEFSPPIVPQPPRTSSIRPRHQPPPATAPYAAANYPTAITPPPSAPVAAASAATSCAQPPWVTPLGAPVSLGPTAAPGAAADPPVSSVQPALRTTRGLGGGGACCSDALAFS